MIGRSALRALGLFNSFFGERVMRLHRVDGRWRIEPRRTLLQAENVGFSVGFDCPKAKRP